MQRDLGTRVTTGSSHIQSLWIKSRLVLLLGNLSHFLFSVTPPLISLLAARASSNPDVAFPLATCLSAPFYTFHAWLSWSTLILSFETQPQTLNKISYLHGSCYTGSYMRRLLLAHSTRSLRVLIRFLLRIERWPYELFLLMGSVVGVSLAFGPFILSKNDWVQELSLLTQAAVVWAPCAGLAFEALLLFLTLRTNIKRLREARSHRLRIVGEDERVDDAADDTEERLDP